MVQNTDGCGPLTALLLMEFHIGQGLTFVVVKGALAPGAWDFATRC